MGEEKIRKKRSSWRGCLISSYTLLRSLPIMDNYPYKKDKDEQGNNPPIYEKHAEDWLADLIP
jgi:hypothetical protein